MSRQSPHAGEVSAAEALELALALHANPQRAAELRARQLPAHGIANLLRLALAQPEALQEAANSTDLPGELLSDAARFFVEQQMLVEQCEGDPWRVLGALPGAPETQLREHHRLLVSLVHPDRSSEWPSAFADRVNKAWRALRSAEGRAQHDAGQLPTLPAVVSPATFRPNFAAAAVPGPVHGGSHRLRHLPAMLVGGIVIVAGGVLLLDDWVRQHYGQPASASLVASPSSLASGPDVAHQGTLQRDLSRVVVVDPVTSTAPTLPSEPGVALGMAAFFSYLGSNWSLYQRAATVDYVLTDAAQVADQQADDEVVLNAPPIERVTTSVAAAPRGDLQSAPARSRATRRSAAPPVAVADVPELPGAAQASQESPPVPNEEFGAFEASSVALAPAASSEIPDVGREQQVRALLDQFGAHFQQGDLIGLLDLFALDANPEHGGVPGLAARYAQLFGNTRSRSVRFDGIHWIEDSGRIRGAANIQITTWTAGQSRRVQRSGRVEFEVMLVGDRALIRHWVASGKASEA